MLRSLPLLVLFALLSFVPASLAPARAQSPARVQSARAQASEAPSGPWTVRDVLRQEGMSQVDVGPEGERLLWVKSTPDFEEDRTTTDLFLTYLNDPNGSGEPATVQLTRTGDNRRPLWSPDGRRIAFLSSREAEEREGTQVWLIDPRGGAPRPLTKLENGVQDAAWLDEETLLIAAREAATHYEEAQEEEEDDARAVEDTTEFYPVRLFTVEAGSGEVERLTENDGSVIDFAASPSGRHVVYALRSSPITADARHQPKQYLLDRRTGEATEIFAEQYFDPSGFAWALDGSGFYAADEYSSDPEHEGAGVTRLYYFDLAERRHVQVPLDWPNGVGYGGYSVAPDGIHVQLADGPRMRPRFYRKQGGTWTPVEVEDERLRHSTSVLLGPRGRTLVFGTSRPDDPPRYYAATYERGRITEATEFIKLNEYLREKPIPEAEVVEWAGARGDTVNGILYYPLGYEEGRRYPLVTVIHGGPSGVDLDAWRLGWTVYAPLWAQRGAFVFRPNYHGSGHHGLDFVESIKENYYELEVPDIVRGIEHLIDEGKVDRDSLGVMGWSNGAILSIALTTEHPDMFEVTAPGAGNVNWISDYGNCAFGVRFDQSYFGAAPWEDVETYIEKSPLFRLERVTAPTLIQFGTEDKAVPTEQGWQHYRALQQMGNAPVRFLLYPGEQHGFRRLSHQQRKVEEDLAWFDTYLFGTTSMEERVAARAVPEDAPLARIERMQAVARTEAGRYGVERGGVLAPEVVALGDTLHVGRFEVTRAQWHAFRPSYEVPPGTADYPATGIGFEEAQAYVQWLSEATGQPYRLPTEAEAEALRKKAGAAENDLAYWLGYAPTPDEHVLVRERLRGIAPDRLLMPVGSRPPAMAEDARAPLVFDLGGNAAEWAAAEDGAGVARGASAVTVHAEKAAEQAAPPAAFIGLRVMRGE